MPIDIDALIDTMIDSDDQPHEDLDQYADDLADLL